MIVYGIYITIKSFNMFTKETLHRYIIRKINDGDVFNPNVKNHILYDDKHLWYQFKISDDIIDTSNVNKIYEFQHETNFKELITLLDEKNFDYDVVYGVCQKNIILTELENNTYQIINLNEKIYES